VFEQRIRYVMERRKVVMAPPETSALAATRLMAKRKVGAVLVVKGKRLVGIFTERDAVVRVMARGLDPKATLLKDVMTPAPQTMSPDALFGHALLVMHENGFRHIPVVEGGVPVGVVSSRQALDPEMEEFISEAQRRKHLRRQLGSRPAQ
jgi:CBS domain-containing protein